MGLHLFELHLQDRKNLSPSIGNKENNKIILHFPSTYPLYGCDVLICYLFMIVPYIETNEFKDGTLTSQSKVYKVK